MRVDRSQSLKRIRITHDVHVESLFLFSMISVNMHHASRITRMWSRGLTNLINLSDTSKFVCSIPHTCRDAMIFYINMINVPSCLLTFLFVAPKVGFVAI